MVIVIRGQRYWLWRAVDNEGEVLDLLVQSKRNAQAALKLMRKLLKKQGWTPTRITTDKLRSYHVAQGSTTSTPVPWKSRTFRVTRTAPRERDMAAIWQSASPMGRPAWRRLAAISA